jgi:ABC-2 type transport system ATP-binding protein
VAIESVGHDFPRAESTASGGSSDPTKRFIVKNAMEKVIETINLTKRFGSFCAVNDVSLSVNKGEIYGFLGLNGAGKTTTIRMLLGLIRPTAGYARVCGKQIRHGGKGPWDRVGSLVEVPYSYPELTVGENLEVVRRMRGITDKSAADSITDKLKLTRYIGKKAGELSLGNSQRLGLAKALLHRPEVLILDEPSNGLDPAGIVEVRHLLIDLAKNHSVTVFVSSHILDEISRLATRIGIIHEGKLLREMDSGEIHSLRRRRLIVGSRDTQQARKILEKEGFAVVEDDGRLMELSDARAIDHPDRIASLLVNSGNPPTALWVREDDLESLFMRMIGSRGENDE